MRPLLVCGLSLGTLACGNTQPPLATVEGVVTLDGEPLPQARVLFTPDSGRASAGVTDATGRYELTYLRELKGALIGSHEVTVNRIIAEGEQAPSPALRDLPPQSVEVQPGPNTINLDF